MAACNLLFAMATLMKAGRTVHTAVSGNCSKVEPRIHSSRFVWSSNEHLGGAHASSLSWQAQAWSKNAENTDMTGQQMSLPEGMVPQAFYEVKVIV